MNKEQTKAAAATMLAFLAGKTIEYRTKGTTQWAEINSPSWSFESSEYRIKPMEFWVSVNENGVAITVCNQPVQDGPTYRVVHVREVQE